MISALHGKIREILVEVIDLEDLLNIAICEDQKEDVDILLDFIKKSGVPSVCNTFFSAEGLLDTFSPGKYDLIFFDIYMNGMHGVKAATKIRQSDENVTLAFTTSSTDHALESYRLNAVKYLEKPINLKDVRETLELTLSKRTVIPRIPILTKGKTQYIPIDTILYLEKNNHAVILHSLSGSIRASQTVKLSDIESMLPRPPFFRCHNSFIVNLSYVKDLDKDLRVFTMQNEGKVYIRRQDVNRASQAYEDYLFQAARGEYL